VPADFMRHRQQQQQHESLADAVHAGRVDHSWVWMNALLDSSQFGEATWGPERDKYVQIL